MNKVINICPEAVLKDDEYIIYENLNTQIDNIILQNSLTKETNPFFKMAPFCQSVSSQIAYDIAINWLEITKTFVLTSAKGLGTLADKILDDEKNSEKRLIVLQTGFSVISDDLNNTNPIFNESAPKGIQGIHYKWWNSSIVEKFFNLVNPSINITIETLSLLNKMREISSDYMGAAVQLRVVEAIAFDIAMAFYFLYGSVKHNGQALFSEEDMLWINAHIKAEKIHNHDVSSQNYGMVKIAQNGSEKTRLLKMIDEYCQVWSATLNSFADLL